MLLDPQKIQQAVDTWRDQVQALTDPIEIARIEGALEGLSIVLRHAVIPDEE
jgi:hypothetical protein